jgi:hypothetical protein
MSKELFCSDACKVAAQAKREHDYLFLNSVSLLALSVTRKSSDLPLHAHQFVEQIVA